MKETPASVASDTLKQEAERSISPPETAPQPPRLPWTGRSTTRELSSSIASNLASARGIPSSRQKRPTPISALVSNQHADGQITHDDGSRRKSSTTQPPAASARPSWAPPLPTTQTEAEYSANDAPFQQFYSAFEGLMSKLSAPLAFAGLPLASNSKPEIPAAQPTPKSPKAPRELDINYSDLISRAALRAVDDPRGNSNVADSFLIVPTSGGTMTYAESLNRIERAEVHALRHTRIPSTLSNISEHDFVDARSTILNQQAAKRKNANEPKVDGKTMEELALKNQMLEKQLDMVVRRLHVFEMSSQTSTAALAQSIRLMPKSPLATPEASRTHTKGTGTGTGTAGKQFANDALSGRVAELEEILKKHDAKARKRDEENAKLRETLGKYREKWDNLKAGAKARREGQNRDRGGGGEGTAA